MTTHHGNKYFLHELNCVYNFYKPTFQDRNPPTPSKFWVSIISTSLCRFLAVHF